MSEVVHLDRHRQRAGKARKHPVKIHPGPNHENATVFFDRPELNRILSLYGRMVSLNEWRDYAIDAAEKTVEFQIYRNSWDFPAYRLIKRHAGAKGRRFAVISAHRTMIEDDRLQAILTWLGRQPAERTQLSVKLSSRERFARRP